MNDDLLRRATDLRQRLERSSDVYEKWLAVRIALLTEAGDKKEHAMAQHTMHLGDHKWLAAKAEIYEMFLGVIRSDPIDEGITAKFGAEAKRLRADLDTLRELREL